MTGQLCACGCGLPAPVPDQSCVRGGWVKGVPRPYRQGHHHRGRRPARDYRKIKTGGAIQKLHRVMAERALGRQLPAGVEVHHVDRDPHSAMPRLVICQDRAYHQLLHVRTSIVMAGGSPERHHICRTCGLLPLREFHVHRDRLRCKACKARYRAAAYRRRIDGTQKEDAATVKYERRK